MIENLNDYFSPTDGEAPPSNDYSIKKENVTFESVKVMFRGIEPELLKLIDKYKDGAIVGCIAWLTSEPILTALSKCKNVSILVQKEDFLRPDLDSGNRFAYKLRKLYENLKCDIDRYGFIEPIKHLSVCGDPSVDPIRCVGNYNYEKSPAFPRTHHKFLVFCRTKEQEENKYGQTLMTPEVVWTGSFNLTKNATYSLENVIILEDKSGINPILQAYLQEHAHVFSLSEPLNWTKDWCFPEYRIGT